MISKIFRRLSVKVFLISFTVQVISGLLICFILYSQTPEMLYSPLEELNDLIESLESAQHYDGDKMIDDFIRRTGIDLAIFDEESYVAGKRNDPVDDIGELTLKKPADVTVAFVKIGDKGKMGSFGLKFKGDPVEYIVLYFYNGENHNLVPRALAGSYKLIIAAVVCVAFASSLIYAFLFARPVRKLSKVSRQMAQMDFTAHCDTKRKDEIGDLARDLNLMSSTLDQKISELEDEITRVKELESQKEMFFAAASHELKTPVTVLEGHLRGMIEGIGPYEDHDEYLARSLRTVKQMESLINEILTVSRMQSADDVVTAEVDMAEVIEGRVKASEELFTIRNIKVNKDTGEGLMFKGNAELTSLAVGAFISNAVFYSSEGSVIDITAKSIDKQIVTKILNRGSHIDEADLPHLFEPFYRADSSRSKKSGGSGLGLYLAKLIITKQDGEADLVNSDDGVLATMTLPST